MRKLADFAVRLVKATNEDNLITHANELTYKLLLSFFPLVVFIMSLLSFLNLDVGGFVERVTIALPSYISDLISDFAGEMFETRNAGVLSGSLIMTVFTASSGFNALIKGLSKVYRQRETRNFLAARLISMGLVLLFAAVIICSLLILIFGDAIYKALLKNNSQNAVIHFAFGLSGYLIVMAAMLFTVILIYKFAIGRQMSVYEAFPGAFVTLGIWVVSSKAFSVYINNFARYSRVYGSIAGVVILMLWLNIISIVILVGGEINALIEFKPKSAESKS